MADPFQLGRYTAVAELASGGMATVYLGRLRGAAGFGRTVAIKRLHPQFAREPGFVSMFVDEARMVARVQHPNVVPTIDVVRTADELFLVLEYVQGEQLAVILRAASGVDGQVPIPIVLAVVIGVLNGLHAAHEARDERGVPLEIVHRDVSPQNVIVGTDGVARVLDFGVAKAASSVHVTREGQLKGKLAYMAPEQVAGNTSRRSDIYAAGIVLWEALTLRRLFVGDNEAQRMHAILCPDVKPPSTHNPAVPPKLDGIVMRSLAVDPRDRYPTAREMAEALDDCLRPASANQVSAWLESMAGPSLAARSKLVTAIETGSAHGGRSVVRDIGAPAIRFDPRDPPSEQPGTLAAATQRSPGESDAGFERTPTMSTGAARANLGILDHPPPSSESREALAKYREALEAFHDGNWRAAETRLAEALSFDPRLAPALLRYSLFGGPQSARFVEKRAFFKRAVSVRNMLSSRDRILLRALEPLMLSDPPDRVECAKRFVAASDRLSGDAEMQVLAGANALTDPASAIRYARRAIEIDPRYADAYELLGISLGELELFDEAHEALGQAIELSPGAHDAHMMLATIAAQEGDASATERCARSAITIDGCDPDYDLLAGALYARGRRPEAIVEVLRRKWSQVTESDRARAQARDEALLAILKGDFEGAMARADEWAQALESNTEGALHGHLAATRVLLALERGDADYGEIAMRFLDSRGGLTGTGSAWHDAAPLCLAAARRAGLLDAEAFHQELCEWRQERRGDGPSKGSEWAVAYAPALSLASDSRVVVEAREQRPTRDAFRFLWVPLLRADAGAALVGIGAVDDGIPLLRRAASTCLAPSEPFRSTHAYYRLGLALVEGGDEGGGRKAFEVVVDRWGSATPRSTTAEDAARRLASLSASPRVSPPEQHQPR